MDKRIIDENKQWIDETWAKVEKKLAKVAVKSRDKLPYTTIDGVHDNCNETRPWWWTNGFWGGIWHNTFIHTYGQKGISRCSNKNCRLLYQKY